MCDGRSRVEPPGWPSDATSGARTTLRGWCGRCEPRWTARPADARAPVLCRLVSPPAREADLVACGEQQQELRVALTAKLLWSRIGLESFAAIGTIRRVSRAASLECWCSGARLPGRPRQGAPPERYGPRATTRYQENA